MLNYIQGILLNVEGELKGIFEFWIKENNSAILKDLLLSWKNTGE